MLGRVSFPRLEAGGTGWPAEAGRGVAGSEASGPRGGPGNCFEAPCRDGRNRTIEETVQEADPASVAYPAVPSTHASVPSAIRF